MLTEKRGEKMSNNTEISTPIRLVLFSSEECWACPEVEMIVHQVVGTSMSDIVHVSTIDVDEDPEAASKYGVYKLPALMVNEEIVLHGSVTEDDVRDILWTRLITEILKTEEIASLRKENMLNITMNALQSVSGEELVRPNIGDYVHLGIVLQTTLSMYALDPLMPELFYLAGREVGKYGAMQYHLSMLNRKIGTTLRPNKRFNEFLKAIVSYYSNVDVLPYLLAEEASYEKISDSEARIYLKNLLTACVSSEFTETTCDFTAGEIAGSAEAITGRSAICIETACQSKGDKACVFHLKLVNDREEAKRPLPLSEDKHARHERRETFFELLHEITLEIKDSLLMKKRLRPKIGDFVHISALQTRIMGLKLMDEFSSSILYAAGREFGVVGPGKPILYEIAQTQHDSFPLSLGEAVKIMKKYLSHPTSYLGREYSFVQEATVDEEQEKYVIRLFEYANSSGAPNLGVKFCDFFAGYLAGRIHLLTEEDPQVIETACQGSGANYCEFSIEPLVG